MKKVILILSLCIFYLSAEENCEQYFEARKLQMQDQIREYDEARQNLEAFKASFEVLQKKISDKSKSLNHKHL